MLITLFGISILVRLLQYENAYEPILVTLFGISILVRLLQPWNADEPMLVTEFGIIVFLHPDINVFVDVFIIALQLSRESYTVFPDSTIIDVKPLQEAKAASPMLVTLLGIVTLVKPLQ